MFTHYTPARIALPFLLQGAQLHRAMRHTYLSRETERFLNGCALELSAWHLGLSDRSKAAQVSRRKK